MQRLANAPVSKHLPSPRRATGQHLPKTANEFPRARATALAIERELQLRAEVDLPSCPLRCDCRRLRGVISHFSRILQEISDRGPPAHHQGEFTESTFQADSDLLEVGRFTAEKAPPNSTLVDWDDARSRELKPGDRKGHWLASALPYGCLASLRLLYPFVDIPANCADK
jgi:hypothetical protein